MEQSSTPWRVFDAPAPSAAGAAAPPGPTEVGRPPSSVVGNQTFAVAAVVGAAVIGVLAIVLAITGGGSSVVDGPQASGDVTAVAAANPGEIVIDVSGAVVTPGLYRLASGARIGDAIDAAGGFSPRVDAERVGRELNLAATLKDGAQVLVPSRDDPGAGGGPGASQGGGGAGGSGGAALVNLNTATEAELDALSGIGPVTAGKIIESRATAPFKTVDELRERGLIGQKTFDKIRAQLTVG